MSQKKSNDLKKHVGAIHSAHQGGLLQRKLCNALLSHAYSDLMKKETHCISISELSKLIGYNSKDTKLLKNTLISLQQTNVQWNVINPETGHAQWGTAGLIGEAIIENGVCFYSYTPGIKKILYEPEMYGRIDMVAQGKFKSSYGLALYENCVRYQGIPQTPWFELNVFRQLLGVPDGKYKNFHDLKSRVIEKAVSEVNKYSPLRVNYEIKTSYSVSCRTSKREKRVDGIRFYFEKSIDQEVGQTLKKLSGDYGIEKTKAKKVLEQFGVKKIIEKIELTELLLQQGKKIENKAGFLIVSLKDDYELPKAIQNQKASKTYKTIEQGIAEREAEELLRVEMMFKILDWFVGLNVEIRDFHLKKFEQYLSSEYPHHKHMFNIKEPFENTMFKDKLLDFIYPAYMKTSESENG